MTDDSLINYVFMSLRSQRPLPNTIQIIQGHVIYIEYHGYTQDEPGFQKLRAVC